MLANLTADAIETIRKIVNRGNKAVVQRKGDGVIIMEEKREVKYRTDSIGSQ